MTVAIALSVYPNTVIVVSGDLPEPGEEKPYGSAFLHQLSCPLTAF
jgi:hypothetical protein